MKTIKTTLLTLVFGTVIWSATSCKHQEVEAPRNDQFCLSDTLAKDVTTAQVVKQKVMNELVLSGEVTADADKSVKVYPLVSGYVQELKVQLGDFVKKGQVLAVVQSGEIADYDNQLVAAKANLATAQRNASSAEEMLKSGLISEKDNIQAKNDLAKAEGDLTRIQQTIKVFGSSNNSLYTITAPVSGFITEKNATENMHYKVEDVGNFFTIANLDEVWVMANVFETDIAKIKEGYEAKVQLLAYPDQVFTGKIDKIFSVLDSTSRVMKARIRLSNKGYLIKPEMFAQVRVMFQKGNDEMLAIPSKAIVFKDNLNYLLVYKDKCHIEPRKIDVQSTVGDTSYIVGDVAEGENVMTKYQLLVFDAITE